MPTQIKIGLWAILGIVVAIFLYSLSFTVEKNQQTVVTRFGDLSYVAGPGLHFKLPIVHNIYPYRTDILQMSPNKPANTYTKDNQEVNVTFTVFYRIDPAKVAYIFEHNRSYETRLMALAIDRLKAAMGHVNVQVLAENRAKIRDQIEATLVEDTKYLGVTITDFQLTEIDYDDAFRKAVSNAAVQKANIESFEYQRQQTIKSAETAAIKAEGEANAVRENAKGAADARILAATAEARAIQMQGEAQAAAIRAQTEALKESARLVELRKAERWDGKLPSSIYAGAPIPFMSVDK